MANLYPLAAEVIAVALLLGLFVSLYSMFASHSELFPCPQTSYTRWVLQPELLPEIQQCHIPLRQLIDIALLFPIPSRCTYRAVVLIGRTRIPTSRPRTSQEFHLNHSVSIVSTGKSRHSAYMTRKQRQPSYQFGSSLRP